MMTRRRTLRRSLSGTPPRRNRTSGRRPGDEDPEGAEKASGQETDNGQKTRQPEQGEAAEGQKQLLNENKTGDRRDGTDRTGQRP